MSGLQAIDKYHQQTVEGLFFNFNSTINEYFIRYLTDLQVFH